VARDLASKCPHSNFSIDDFKLIRAQLGKHPRQQAAIYRAVVVVPSLYDVPTATLRRRGQPSGAALLCMAHPEPRRRVMWRELMGMASTGRNCPAQEAEGGCSMVLLVGQWVSLSLHPMHLGAYRPRSDANSWPQLPNAALLSILLRLATNSRRERVTPSTFPPPISGRRSSGWAVKGRPGMPAMALIRAELPSWREHRLTPHVGVAARGVAVRSAI